MKRKEYTHVRLPMDVLAKAKEKQVSIYKESHRVVPLWMCLAKDEYKTELVGRQERRRGFGGFQL